MFKISVVIPCYNEEKTISKVIEKIPKEVFEIIVVDNNSTDRGAKIAKKLGAKVVKEKKQGYGAALKRGFKEATGDIIVTLDADGQYPGEKILELVDYFEKNNLDFLNCSRFPLENKESLSFTRRLGNYFLTFLFNILFLTNIKDSQSGMMIFKKEIFKNINLENDDMPLSEELKIKVILKGYKFKEISIPYYQRKGESKLFPIKHGIMNSLFLLKLRIKTIDKKFLKIIPLILIILIYAYFASFNLNKPFINVTSDTNGENGLAVLNWINGGMLKLKFGKYVNGYLKDSNFNFEEIQKQGFYTHHPVFYLLPTYFLYKIFGVSELTTRLGPFIIFVIGIIFFYFALIKIFNNIFYAFLTTLIFSILPGTIYYGTTFELAVFSLPTALITFSLFVFYYYSKKEIYFYLLLFSIILGGLMGWFYFFMPASIWIYLLFDKTKDFIQQRKKLLILIPIISVLIFSLNLIHIYILSNVHGIEDLISAFKFRSQKFPLNFWLRDINGRMDLNFGIIFKIASLFVLVIFLTNFKKYKIFTPLILMPILNTIVFYQWSTHPFGVIFFLPTITLLNSVLIVYIINELKNLKFLRYMIAFVILISGFYFGLKQYSFLVNKFLILGERDIQLIKELKPQIQDNDLCLGKNQMGLYYGGIVMWYLEKNILMEEHNEDCSKAKIAIIFHPQLGEFYNQEANKFISMGFKPIGCADLWCVLIK